MSGVAWASVFFSLKLWGDPKVQPWIQTMALGCELLEREGHVPLMSCGLLSSLLHALLPPPLSSPLREA